jgi:signal transduction histidine kinase
LALFLVAFGALMLGVAVTLKIAIRSAIAARLKAESISTELVAALDAADEARNSKARFIAAATHDLRQPLQAAALFFNRIVARQTGEHDAAVINARLAFGEASSLLERLLDHLRLDGGMIQPQIGPTPLGELLSRVCSEVSEIAAASGFTIRCVASSAVIDADQHLLVRILRNLLHNAMRHSRGTRILIGVRRRHGQAVIYVVDNGRGIALSEVETLFDEAKQAGEVRQGQHGTGLGLPSSVRMAGLMHGTVGFDARWRHGAAFYCMVPSAG